MLKNYPISQFPNQEFFLVTLKDLFEYLLFHLQEWSRRIWIQNLKLPLLIVLQLYLLVSLHPVIKDLHFLVRAKTSAFSRPVRTPEHEPDDISRERLIGNRHFSELSLLLLLFDEFKLFTVLLFLYSEFGESLKFFLLDPPVLFVLWLDVLTRLLSDEVVDLFLFLLLDVHGPMNLPAE